MKLSVNWLRYLNDTYHCAADPMPNGINELVEKIGAQLGQVEQVINVGDRYKGIVTVKVISAQKHPNADKLKVCMVDDGGVIKDVKRDSNDHVEVVCGATNIAAGQTVAWIPPGATVPSTFDKDPFIIEKREIRGVVSNGMIASPKELALGDDHDGILVIDEPAKPGTPFAKLYNLDDFVIDIENKMFTHRPDLFGQLGLAREIAGIYGHAFKSPDWYRQEVESKADGRNGKLKFEVKNQLPKLVPRFCAQVIKDVKVGPSPVWLQAALSTVGVRSINNIVDLTNFYMMETAQPLHAFDYDKLNTGVLGVRLSKKGEKLLLLNSKEISLEAGDMVITDGQKPVGLAGVMGGAETEVDENTKTIILECANFDMNQVRKTAMRYGLFTDASTRFTKNQSPLQNKAVINKTAQEVLKIAGGRLAGPLIDDSHIEGSTASVKTDIDFINSRLGLKLSAAEVKKLLTNVEFDISVKSDDINVVAPFYRTDIKIAEDVVEEVGRLYGYDKLPHTLPKRTIQPIDRNNSVDLKDSLRQQLAVYGANEVLTYSFVHGSLFQKVGQPIDNAYQLKNALSPDLQYYRLSLTPSLLSQIHPNAKRGFDKFGIFEIGKSHVKTIHDEDGLPRQLERLALVLAANSKLLSENQNGSAFFWAKKYLVDLLDKFGVEYDIRPVERKYLNENIGLDYMVKPFEYSRSAGVYVSDYLVGVVGEYTHTTKKNLKLPNYCAGFEVFLSAFKKIKGMNYQPLNKYPEIDQDICLRTEDSFNYQALTDFMRENLSALSAEHGYNNQLEPLDIFKKEDDKKHKQTTWRISLWHAERTLTTDEVNNLMDKLASAAKQHLKAERI